MIIKKQAAVIVATLVLLARDVHYDRVCLKHKLAAYISPNRK
jgi:hypothetical protein